jgi:hypothetical protein
MNAKIPKPVHLSYEKHRKQRMTQIILPVVLTVVFVIALIVLLVKVTLFQGAGDVERWAAVSTIWIAIPIIIAMLIFLALLIGIIYLLARLLNITPTYTGMVQDYVRKAAVYIKQGADAMVKPVIQFKGFLAKVEAFFQRK